MKQEIKFRVWCPKRNIYVVQGNPLSDFFDDFAALRTYVIEKDLVWQQYIGIQDSNGIDIYDGDFIQYKEGTKTYDKNFQYDTVLVRRTDNGHDNHPGWVIRDTYGQFGDAMIIGNIFENPELLQKIHGCYKGYYHEILQNW